MLAHYQTWFNLPHALPLRLLQMFEEKEAATKLLKPEATAASVVHYKLKIHSKTLKYFMAMLWLVLSRTQWLSVSVNPMTNWRPVQCVSFLHLQFSDLYQKSVRVRGVVLKKNQKKNQKQTRTGNLRQTGEASLVNHLFGPSFTWLQKPYSLLFTGTCPCTKIFILNPGSYWSRDCGRQYPVSNILVKYWSSLGTLPKHIQRICVCVDIVCVEVKKKKGCIWDFVCWGRC